MLDQMKRMRLNRTAMLNSTQYQKPASVMALSNDSKKE